MKKKVLFLLSCMFVAINIQMQAQQLPESVVLNHDTIVLALGTDTTLIATVLPNNTTNKSVKWTLLDGISVIDTVGTIQDTICVVEGISVGTARIVVHTVEGNFRDTCVIHVVIPVTDVKIVQDTIKVVIGAETTFAASVLPFGAIADSVKWSNSSPNVASFEIEDDTICVVQTLNIGEAEIFVNVYFGDSTFRDSCVIQVYSLPVVSLTFDADSVFMTIGTDSAFKVHPLPLTGIDKRVLWSSMHPGIVDRVSSGFDTISVFRAKAAGIAHIVAQSVYDHLITDTCVVTVLGIPADTMYLNTDTMVMHILKDTTLIARVLPRNTTDKSIVWVSSDSTIVDIKSNSSNINDTICHLSALRSGTAQIKAKSVDGGFVDSCFIRVIVPVTKLVMNKDSIFLDIGDLDQMIAGITPDSATYKSLVWTISDISIVDTITIQRDTICFVKALKAGIAYVYAATPDGLFRDSCVVTVRPILVNSVKVSKDSLKLPLNEVFTLTAKILPADASDLTVVWTSKDSTTVNILSTGSDTICKIKALKLGETKIFVVTNNGAKKDSCVVTVIPNPITKLVIQDDSLTAYLDNDFKTFIYYLNVVPTPPSPQNSSIIWTSSDSSVVDLSAMSADTIIELLPKRIGEAVIYARTLNGLVEDSCVVTVKDQFLALASDTISLKGIISLSLIIPDNSLLSGFFELHLPKDFGLMREGDGYKAALSDDFKDDYKLNITKVNDSIYLFDINPLITAATHVKSGSTVSLLEFMKIAYNIYNVDLNGSKKDYLAKLTDVYIELKDTTLLDDRIDIVIRSFYDPTGNVVIVNPARLSYFYNNQLYVNSGKAETIYVYSLNGSLLFSGKKPEGQAVFNLPLSEKILIVQGSSGWSEKVANP